MLPRRPADPTSTAGAPRRGPIARFGRTALRTAADAVLPRAMLVRRVRTTEREVALTFDDGPDEQTPELLRILERLGLTATFFVLGENVRRFPEHVDAMIQAGHEVASHGYEHRSVVSMSWRELAEDLAMTAGVLPHDPRPRPLFRPPRGALDLGSFATTAWLGYTIALWSFDSFDHRGISPDAIASRFDAHQLAPGEIALFHEGERSTRGALPRIAASLHRRGLATTTLSRLLDEAK